MNEKLLALLLAKFPQARKDGLKQLARTLAIQVADEAEAQALVEKLTSDKVTDFIKDWRKDVDTEVSNANKTYEGTLKDKYDFVEKKTPVVVVPPTGDTPEWAKQLIEQNKKLAEKVSALETGTAVTSRKQILEKKLEKAPELMKASILKNFARMTFANDEEFNEFITDTETDVAKSVQESANSNLGSFPRPTATPQASAEKAQVSEDIKDWAKQTQTSTK